MEENEKKDAITQREIVDANLKMHNLQLERAKVEYETACKHLEIKTTNTLGLETINNLLETNNRTGLLLLVGTAINLIINISIIVSVWLN